MELSQYMIVLVNLDPIVESEVQKTRPCVIISPNEMNIYLNTIVIVPMASSLKKYPTRVPVKHNGKKRMIAIEQIRTIDKLRIIKTFEKLTATEIASCKAILKETFVD